MQLLREQSLVLNREKEFDRTEVQRTYYRMWADVFRYALLLLRHREDAEDVAAEAFRRALEACDDGHGPKGDVLPWLFVITRRIVIDRRRRHRLIGWLPLASVSEPSDPDEAMRRSEVWIWFEQLCRALPEAQREALILRYQFDMSDAEAASVMGISVGSVRTRVSRGLATLRQKPEVIER